MRNRNMNVDTAMEEDEDPGWVKLDSPTNQLEADTNPAAATAPPVMYEKQDGSGIQLSGGLQSMIERTDLTAADMKRGRDLLTKKRIDTETEAALGRQAAAAKADCDAVLNYIMYGFGILVALYLFFRFGPVLRKPGAPTEHSPVMEQIKADAVDKLGKPLADFLMGTRL